MNSNATLKPPVGMSVPSEAQIEAAAKELRVDTSNGVAYTRSEFLQFYGTRLGAALWARGDCDATAWENAWAAMDTTGDGRFDTWDTTGDGTADAWDTKGDGKMDARDGIDR